MNDKRSPFYAYRYLVTPMSVQTTIFQQINKSKEELMSDIVCEISNNNKSDWTKGNKRYLFYGSQNKENLHIIKFARETNEKLYIEGDEDIEIQPVKEAKFVYLIVDTEFQIILIERNGLVFQTIEGAVNILADFFRQKMRQYDYIVNIYPLVSNKKFWNYVESADEIYELSLVMNAPNMALFGFKDTQDVLKKIKETTNNEEFDIAFKNKEGKLKITKESLGGWIDYVREVGGKYLLKFSKDGLTQTKTSQTDTLKTYLEKKRIEKYSNEDLENISLKLATIHKLESRDEEEKF